MLSAHCAKPSLLEHEIDPSSSFSETEGTPAHDEPRHRGRPGGSSAAPHVRPASVTVLTFRNAVPCPVSRVPRYGVAGGTSHDLGHRYRVSSCHDVRYGVTVTAVSYAEVGADTHVPQS